MISAGGPCWQHVACMLPTCRQHAHATAAAMRRFCKVCAKPQRPGNLLRNGRNRSNRLQASLLGQPIAGMSASFPRQTSPAKYIPTGISGRHAGQTYQAGSCAKKQAGTASAAPARLSAKRRVTCRCSTRGRHIPSACPCSTGKQAGNTPQCAYTPLPRRRRWGNSDAHPADTHGPCIWKRWA